PSPPGRKHRPPDRGPADLDQFEAPLGKLPHLIRLSKAPSLPCPLFPPRRFEIGQPTARLDTGNQEEVYRAGSVGARESYGLNSLSLDHLIRPLQERRRDRQPDGLGSRSRRPSGMPAPLPRTCGSSAATTNWTISWIR